MQPVTLLRTLWQWCCRRGFGAGSLCNWCSRTSRMYVETYGKSNVKMSDGEIAEKLKEIFDMRPAFIVKRFGLKNPVFEELLLTDTWDATHIPKKFSLLKQQWRRKDR
jgi:S-adenosylmethionine synthetase